MKKQGWDKEDAGRQSNCRLYIGNLAYETKVSNLRECFGKYGDIVSIQIKKGFAFLEYERSNEANNAMQGMNLKNFNGRTIIVRAACKTFVIYRSETWRQPLN
jgi:RNA recognition motif-containing protein